MRNLQYGKKSSFHWVSGDIPLGGGGKALYKLGLHLERFGSKLSAVSSDCESYVPELDVARLVRVFGPEIRNRNPTRILCADFILNRAASVFGETPDIVDLGCGEGGYSQNLKLVTDYGTYQGYDIEPRLAWKEYETPSVRFAKARLGYAPLQIGQANAIFSQSALEHIEYDKSAIALLRPDRERTLSHLHLIPGIPSYFEHRYHGYRRYGPREIRNLIDLPGISDVRISHFGNWITREFFWEMRNRHKPQVSSIFRQKSGVFYDKSLSTLENLVIHREKIVTQSMREASFIALTFKQAACPEDAGP
ncbi:class I SAM-dependent methyltransferase [Breoghania sp. JC706]|uniref:class I SAM-dependent methyltransferase n=1 Tax=Breoghania sp. JC706 TaxID=3117732 RepID=UPI003009A621